VRESQSVHKTKKRCRQRRAHDCPNSDLLRCTDDAHESVVEKRRTNPIALLADIDSKTGEDRDRDREVLR
jgi:hypothetical protein